MLASAERQGIEIDFCPSCWGIWLDRGELNIIVERSREADVSADTGGGPFLMGDVAEARRETAILGPSSIA
jgi:Zn-finger nucleic acid-binding protein